MVVILESSGEIDEDKNGFSKPIEQILDSHGVEYETISLKSESEKLIRFEKKIISEHIPIIISGGFVELTSEEEWFLIGRRIINNIVKNENPMLGICFGAQMIFSCFYPDDIIMNQVGEIGTINLNLYNMDKLFDKYDKKNFFVFHFDGMRYSAMHDKILPIGLERINNFEIYQAYKIKGCQIYGVQFHPEFNKESFKNLLIANKKIIESKYYRNLESIIIESQENYFVNNIIIDFIYEVRT